MSEPPTNPADWYPDPYGRHELRYWDGAQWTEHVSSHGTQRTDAPTGDPKTVVGAQSPDKVQRQVAGQAKVTSTGPVGATGNPIFDASVLVVNQKAKLIEVNNEYAIYDEGGTQIGLVRQVGQSKAKKAMRVLTSLDQFMTHKLQVVDMAGNVLLAITRPAKIVKSRVLISDGAGNEVGEIVQENMFGKIRFGLHAAGQQVGTLNAQNWRAWNFSIADADGNEIAKVTKTWEGLAKTLFTTADNYVVQIHRALDDPLRSMVVAAALTVDTALKQDNRGLG